jgi:hypothetical protein
MRYDIKHVLEGIGIALQQELEVRETELDHAVAKQAADLEQARRGPVRLSEALQDLLVELEKTSQLSRDDYNSRIEKLKIGNWTPDTLPPQYELNKHPEKIGKLAGEVDRIAAALRSRNSPMENFLRGLLDGGETHVSQHSIKQAGFNPAELTRYVTARRLSDRQKQGD